MANILDIIILPTYSTYTMAVQDASTYDVPSTITSPLLDIVVPGFFTVSNIVFVPSSNNIINSTTLGISSLGEEQPLPDGIYCFTYKTSTPTDSVEKSIMRVDKLLQKFDEAFMQLDMMECDRAIKTQSKVDLNTIWFLIQGSIAAANNCAVVDANTLYLKADSMLDNFLTTNCNCSGNNYVINFQ